MENLVFQFSELTQLKTFTDLLEQQKSRMEERRKKNLEKALRISKEKVGATQDFNDSNPQKFLVEIVGAVGCDIQSDGSFVSVTFGDRLVHKTETVKFK